MRAHKGLCIEINEVFYESLALAGRIMGCADTTIKNRCLSPKFPNYKIVPYRIIYTEKKCYKCGKTKLLKEFYEHSTNKDKLRSSCKKCDKKYGKERTKNNPEYQQKYYQDHKEKTDKRNIEWNKNNPAYQKNYKKKKRESDPIFRLNEIVSNSISRSLKGMKNGAHLKDLVDWTIEELIAHLESKFTEGMSWGNYGKGDDKWNLDHVKAKSKFNITSNTCQEFKDCWALDNLQPLWEVRNKEKGDSPMEPKYLIKPDWIK